MSYRQATDNALFGQRLAMPSSRAASASAARPANVELSFYDSRTVFEDPAPPPLFVNPRSGSGRMGAVHWP